MPRPPLSVTIIAKNEEGQIAQAIRSVAWAEEVLVVDSGSQDRTREIAEAEGARVIHHDWQGYGQQKNFAQEQARHDWVLSLDADERVSPELAAEIRTELGRVDGSANPWAAFSMARRTFYLGRWIRYGGWYPNVLIRLSNRRLSRWTEPNVHEQLLVRGKVLRLKHDLEHDSFGSVHDQVLTNVRFSQLGTSDLRSKGKTGSVVLLLFKPIGKFIETYLLKRGFLDGLAGLIISVNAAHSMFMKYAALLESRLRRDAQR